MWQVDNCYSINIASLHWPIETKKLDFRMRKNRRTFYGKKIGYSVAIGTRLGGEKKWKHFLSICADTFFFLFSTLSTRIDLYVKMHYKCLLLLRKVQRTSYSKICTKSMLRNIFFFAMEYVLVSVCVLCRCYFFLLSFRFFYYSNSIEKKNLVQLK